jgi:hypothetical protein
MEPLLFVRGEARAESNRRCVERRSGAPLLFVRGEARAENNRRCVERRSRVPLLFVRGATCVKSISFC